MNEPAFSTWLAAGRKKTSVPISSAAFSTPIGYQTNTLVYGPGGYRFTDFTRVGLPLNVILWIVASLLIPMFWPLVPVG